MIRLCDNWPCLISQSRMDGEASARCNCPLYTLQITDAMENVREMGEFVDTFVANHGGDYRYVAPKSNSRIPQRIQAQREEV